MSDFQTLQLPLPGSAVTHTLFYRASSALEVDAFNLPLAASAEDAMRHLTDIFGLFGRVAGVALAKDGRRATVTFESRAGAERALAGRRKHGRDPPLAVAGAFGLARLIAKHRERRPPLEALERVSSEFIREFEAGERQAAGRRTVRMTQAEEHEVMRRYHEKVKRMQSADFYSFQQRDRPSLVTELLGDDAPAPRHLKKRPKQKAQRPAREERPS
jgi:hypothetical protein